MKIHAALAGLLALLVAQVTQAQVTVSRSVIDFNSGEKIQDFEVYNSSKHKVWLSLQVSEVLDPASENAQRVALKDPRTADVLVSPSRMLLPPGQQKRVRVILRKPATDKERVFRLSVLPHTGRVKLAGETPSRLTGGIKVLLGYDLLLVSRPDEPVPQIQASRREDSVKFVNTGNTNVMMQRISQCFVKTGDCFDLPTKRLYAGETLELEIDPESATPWIIETVQASGEEAKTVVY